MSRSAPAAAPVAPAPPPEGLLTRLRKDLADVTPVLALLPAVIGAYLVRAAANTDIIELDKLGAEGKWGGDSFANLAWLGLVASVVLFVSGRSRARTGTLTILGISSLVLFGCTIGTFSLAWVHGRENYWDAYHFAALLWTIFGSAVLSLASFKIAGDRGSIVAEALVGVAAVAVLICLLVWTYTWSSQVQDLEGWIARTLWQATHG